MSIHYQALPRMTDNEFYDRIFNCLVKIKAIADLISASQQNDIIVYDDTIQAASTAVLEDAHDALYLLDRWLANKRFSQYEESKELVLMTEKEGEVIYQEKTNHEWWLQKSNGAVYYLTEDEAREWYESKNLADIFARQAILAESNHDCR